MQTLLERLAAIPYTGALSDILDEMGYRRQVLPSAIQAIQPGQTLAGRALTVDDLRPALRDAFEERFQIAFDPLPAAV